MAEENMSSGGGKDAEENKAMAAIGYLGILFLVPLLAAKNSPFAQYHAKQGLVLFILEVIIGALSALPFIGWFIVGPIGGIITIILFIMGIINALGGKQQPLPVIGKFGEKIKI